MSTTATDVLSFPPSTPPIPQDESMVSRNQAVSPMRFGIADWIVIISTTEPRQLPSNKLRQTRFLFAVTLTHALALRTTEIRYKYYISTCGKKSQTRSSSR